jgi:hypothetical protein
MRLSQLVEAITADLKANGDTENVALGLAVTGSDGKRYRLDAVLSGTGDFEIIRDTTVVSGMACIVADYNGPHELFL